MQGIAGWMCMYACWWFVGRFVLKGKTPANNIHALALPNVMVCGPRYGYRLIFHILCPHTVPTPTTPCYDGQVLLANSTYSYINGNYFYGGRVEVCYNGTYRPVCDDGWTDSDAAVVCYQEGYSYYSKHPSL